MRKIEKRTSQIFTQLSLAKYRAHCCQQNTMTKKKKKKRNKVLEKLILLFFDKLKSVHLKSFLVFPLTYICVRVCMRFRVRNRICGCVNISKKFILAHTLFFFFLTFLFSVIGVSHSNEINGKYTFQMVWMVVVFIKMYDICTAHNTFMMHSIKTYWFAHQSSTHHLLLFHTERSN